MALGLGTRAGAEQMAQMLVWRAFSLMLVGVGWGALLHAAGERDDLEHCAEPVRRHPVGVLALALGLLSLAGFPLSPGGIGRWLLLDRETLAQPVADWPATTRVLVLAGTAASVGVVIALGACLGATTDDGRGPRSVWATDNPSAADGEGEASTGDQEAEEDTEEQGERRARRKRTVETLLGAGVSLLALWLIGGFVLRPGPWLEIARHLVGELAFPGG